MSENPDTKRPLVVAILAILGGIAAIAALLGFVRHNFGWLFPLFAMVAGAAGGTFAWIVAERYNRQKTWFAAALGLLITAAVYLGHRYVDYLIVMHAVEGEISFWHYITIIAESGTNITMRLGSGGGLPVGEAVTWGLWIADALAALITGTVFGKTIHIDLEELRSMRR